MSEPARKDDPATAAARAQNAERLKELLAMERPALLQAIANAALPWEQQGSEWYVRTRLIDPKHAPLLAAMQPQEEEQKMVEGGKFLPHPYKKDEKEWALRITDNNLRNIILQPSVPQEERIAHTMDQEPLLTEQDWLKSREAYFKNSPTNNDAFLKHFILTAVQYIPFRGLQSDNRPPAQFII